MNGIYLAAYRAYHPNHDIVYQDINGERDLDGDMLEIDLSKYDFIIATPPCNYYSRANWRRNQSDYSIQTKHLLPGILNKLIKLNKPFIVENVRNKKLFKRFGLYDVDCFIYEYGRHTYWTNIMVNLNQIIQIHDNIQYKEKNVRQGGINVHNVIEYWLENVKESKGD